MKNIFSVCVIGLLGAANCYAEGQEINLDALIDKRITANKKLAADYAEEAKETSGAEFIVPLEKSIGETWDALLRRLKQSDDRELKILMIRAELQGELLDAYFDAEYPEEGASEQEVLEKMVSAKKALEEFEKLVKEAVVEKNSE